MTWTRMGELEGDGSPASNEIGVRRAVPGERSDVFCGHSAREKHGAFWEMVREDMKWPD